MFPVPGSLFVVPLCFNFYLSEQQKLPNPLDPHNLKRQRNTVTMLASLLSPLEVNTDMFHPFCKFWEGIQTNNDMGKEMGHVVGCHLPWSEAFNQVFWVFTFSRMENKKPKKEQYLGPERHGMEDTIPHAPL